MPYSYDMTGFTGHAIFVFRDDAGNILDVQTSSSYGVNGDVILGAPSDRTDIWRGQLPSIIANKIAKIEVTFTQNEIPSTERLKDALVHVIGTATTLVQLKNLLGQ